MSTEYERLLSNLREAYVRSAEAVIASIRAQDEATAAAKQVADSIQQLSKYVESLEVQIKAPPS